MKTESDRCEHAEQDVRSAIVTSVSSFDAFLARSELRMHFDPGPDPRCQWVGPGPDHCCQWVGLLVSWLDKWIVI